MQAISLHLFGGQQEVGRFKQKNQELLHTKFKTKLNEHNPKVKSQLERHRKMLKPKCSWKARLHVFRVKIL